MKQLGAIKLSILIASAALVAFMFQNCAPQGQFNALHNAGSPHSHSSQLPSDIDHDPLELTSGLQQKEMLQASSASFGQLADLDPSIQNLSPIEICPMSSIGNNLCRPGHFQPRTRTFIGKRYTLEKIVTRSMVAGEEATVRNYTNGMFNIHFLVPQVSLPSSITGSSSDSNQIGSLRYSQSFQFSATANCNQIAHTGDGTMERRGFFPLRRGQLRLNITHTHIAPDAGARPCEMSPEDLGLSETNGFKELLEAVRSYSILKDSLVLETNIVGVYAVFKLHLETRVPVQTNINGNWRAKKIIFADGCLRISGSDQSEFGCTMALVNVDFTKANEVIFLNGNLSGRAACNIFRGNYNFPERNSTNGTAIQFSNVISTGRGCDSASMKEESILLRAFENAESFSRVNQRELTIRTTGSALLHLEIVD